MRRLVVFCGAAFLFLAFGASVALAQIPDKFTNLKVLPKDIAKRDLVETMRSFSMALGVTCQHCHVEKDGACGEIANRQLTLSYGTNGVQTVNDTAQNWRNVAPCGN